MFTIFKKLVKELFSRLVVLIGRVLFCAKDLWSYCQFFHIIYTLHLFFLSSILPIHKEVNYWNWKNSFLLDKKNRHIRNGTSTTKRNQISDALSSKYLQMQFCWSRIWAWIKFDLGRRKKAHIKHNILMSHIHNITFSV